MKTLCIIPARGGSKGILKKNIKHLFDKPLIYYTLDMAQSIFENVDICVSSDNDEIISTVELKGIKVPFKRPDNISGDKSGTYEVLLHAINYYEQQGINYDNIMLLQPTSPFRRKKDLENMIRLYRTGIDMVVSVGQSHNNPYFNLFEENEIGFLEKCKIGNFVSRQESPPVYFYNGSVYLINIQSLKEKPISNFTKICKYEMNEIYSIDIDTPLDWMICETILTNGLLKEFE